MKLHHGSAVLLLLLLGCEGAQPGVAAWSCSTPFQAFELELALDCRTVLERIALAQQLGEDLVPAGELATAAAVTSVHVRDVNSWWTNGPTEGVDLITSETWPASHLEVGRNTSSLLHEWFHAWEWQALRVNNWGHGGWDTNGFAAADQAFARKVR